MRPGFAKASLSSNIFETGTKTPFLLRKSNQSPFPLCGVFFFVKYKTNGDKLEMSHIKIVLSTFPLNEQ